MKNSFICAALILLACEFSLGQTFKVLHSFSDFPNDGAHSVSDVAFDGAGNLYGTAAGGNQTGCGEGGCGTVFELSPNGDGGWSESVIYNFCSVVKQTMCADGAFPFGGVVVDSKGNLYGTTTEGGISACPLFGSAGCGVVFELSPPKEQGGSWTETVLYNFCSIVKGQQCLDGMAPVAQLTLDHSGNLYGTTNEGGSGHANPPAGGTAFELSSTANGWTETVLYSFCTQGTGDNCLDGVGVFGGLTFDTSGNLYGTTTYSGSDQGVGGGTVYELTRNGNGWKHKTLLAIPVNSKSSVLQASVSLDFAGNLYSTFSAPNGGVFQMNLASHQIKTFSFNGTDGLDPIGGVYIDDSKGALYGSTSGSDAGPGNIFKIAKTGKETVLHTFCSYTDCADGEIPWSILVPDKAGNLYGTTEFGGVYGVGVVFEITP